MEKWKEQEGSGKGKVILLTLLQQCMPVSGSCGVHNISSADSVPRVGPTGRSTEGSNVRLPESPVSSSIITSLLALFLWFYHVSCTSIPAFKKGLDQAVWWSCICISYCRVAKNAWSDLLITFSSKKVCVSYFCNYFYAYGLFAGDVYRV